MHSPPPSLVFSLSLSVSLSLCLSSVRDFQDRTTGFLFGVSMNPSSLFSSGMTSSNGVGVMAVVAISGSVVLVSMQMHKRLVAEFMKKVECELGSEKHRQKKKVRFAEDVSVESSSTGKYSHKKNLQPSQITVGKRHDATANKDATEQERSNKIPPNRLTLYRGIMEYNRMTRGRSAAYS